MEKVCRLIAGAMLLLAPLWRAAPAYAQISAEQTMDIGRDLLASEDYVLAIQYFNKAIKAKPYLPDPYLMRGLAKMMLTDYAGAEADCSAALDLNPYKREPYRVRGLSRLHLRKDSAALSDFEAGLAQKPDDRTFLYYKGICESRLRQHDHSNATFATLQRLYPGFAPGFTAQAREMMALGDTAAAKNLLDKALGTDKYALEPLVLRARMALADGDWTLAVRLLDRAISVSPRDDKLYVNRGVARMATGDKARASSDFSAALEMNPSNSQARHDLALARANADLKDFRICEPSAPDISLKSSVRPAVASVAETEPFGFFALSFTHPYTDGRPVTYPLAELESINRSHWLPSGLYLSRTAGETPEAEQAVALFDFAENLEERHPAMGTPHYLGRAVAYAMLKDYESALADLDKVIAMKPDFIAPLLERAFVRIAMADIRRLTRRIPDKDQAGEAGLMAREAYTRAVEDLDSALRLDPTLAYAWYDKALALFLLGDLDTAVGCYTQAIAAEPSFAEAYFNRGLLLKRLGRRDEAAADMSRAGELGVYGAYTLLKTL